MAFLPPDRLPRHRGYPAKAGNRHAIHRPYEVFATAEGDLFIGAGNDRLFHTLADELGLPELRDDPRYGSNEARVANKAGLRAAIQKALLSHPATAWETRLNSRSVPCSAVRTVADLAADPQLAALELLTSYPHPQIPDLRLIDMPVSAGKRRAAHRYPPPLLGEHTDQVLAELGIDDTRIRELRSKGIIA